MEKAMTKVLKDGDALLIMRALEVAIEVCRQDAKVAADAGTPRVAAQFNRQVADCCNLLLRIGESVDA